MNIPLAGEIFLCNVKGHVSISIILYIVKGQWSIIITLSLSFSQLQAPSTVSPMNIPLAVNKHYPLHCQKSKVNYHHSFSQLQAPPSTVSPMNIPLAGKIFLCNVKGQRSCVNKHYPLHYQRSKVNGQLSSLFLSFFRLQAPSTVSPMNIPLAGEIFLTIVLVTIISIAIFGNSMVCLAISRSRSLRAQVRLLPGRRHRRKTKLCGGFVVFPLAYRFFFYGFYCTWPLRKQAAYKQATRGPTVSSPFRGTSQLGLRVLPKGTYSPCQQIRTGDRESVVVSTEPQQYEAGEGGSI